ncbi:hypothetical protein, conserved [Eimeria brunetti]|uniref:Uncharacterized protein n=1 Tax=Eimeria brunetti TaxID=51314 RepID=U6LZ36_9EIME|nr:hypothetical protein, conserved [Eimeria brunetti]
MMGLADLPYLMQQRLRAGVRCYRSTSLYHRNLGFFFAGILGGSIWGTYKRKANDATNADCAAVHLTFYDLPAALLQQKDDQPSSGEQTGGRLSFQRRRAFEKIWEESARLLQKQPGYTYTQMFRRSPPDEEVKGAGLTNATDVELEHRSSGRKGVSAGIETSNGSEDAQDDQRATDYVELRVWENEESRRKADILQAPLVQKMQELGVKMDGGVYGRVFDDALVRLIQLPQ